MSTPCFVINIHQLVLSPSMEYTLSAMERVDFLWETRIIVLSFTSFKDLSIMPSLRISRLLVGSSRSIIFAVERKALAMPILCFSPLESLPPSSPIGVS